jgi:hypothetical protein
LIEKGYSAMKKLEFKRVKWLGKDSSLFHYLSGLLLLMASLGLVACNANTSSDNTGNGELVVGLTDAPGDYASYTVDVLSLTLTRANGEVVEAMPVSTRVDFAQYTDMTEFLTAATVPSGLYVKASMVLDYSNADIMVENDSGEAVKVDNIVDSDGKPLSQLEVSVQLDDRNRLLIAPGVPSQLTLDFNLEASNTVVFDGSGVPTLTVEPFLAADLNPETPKVHRLRGPLASVDVADNRFQVILRPFHHVINTDHHRDFGALDVVSTDNTIYDIDGTSYQGQSGLEALDAEPLFTAIVVIGDLKMHPRRFEAREVYAGSSVPGGSLDAVTGNVVARVGDVITVKGATLVRAGGSVIFNDAVTVDLGDMTTVKRQLSIDNTYTINDLSVGQRVRVFGTLINIDASHLELDAGVSHQGYVQMRLTTLRGTVVGTGGSFDINLQAIDGRRVSLFDFSGTGSSADNDADPLQYEIDPGSLDISTFTDGSPVKVRGFVRPFGQAPKDFEAQTIIDVTQLRAVMITNWSPVSDTAIENLSVDGMTLNLDGIGQFHYLVRGRVVTDLLGQATAPQMVPRGDGAGLFVIKQDGTRQLYTTFADFVLGLDDRLANGALVKYLGAQGSYDDVSVTLTTGFIVVGLQ